MKNSGKSSLSRSLTYAPSSAETTLSGGRDPSTCDPGCWFPLHSERGEARCSLGSPHTHTRAHAPHVSVYVWHSLSVHALLLRLRSILRHPSPPWYPVMYSCTSISILPAPSPVEQDIPPAVSWFSNCACGPGRKENAPPPPWNRMVFPFATHTPCLCECMAILSPNPPPVEQDGFPFCSETHTHTHTPTHPTCLCMYGISLRTCSSAKPPFHSLVCGPSGVRYGVRHACRGGPPGLEASGPCIWGGYHWGGGAHRTTIYIYIYIYICDLYIYICIYTYIHIYIYIQSILRVYNVHGVNGLYVVHHV